jgi:hypothetical protein
MVYRFSNVVYRFSNALLKYCQSLDLVARPEDLQPLPDQSLALPFLPTKDGYSCCQCRFLAGCIDNIRKHVNRVHKLTWAACTSSYQRVKLQSWFPDNRAKFWIIQVALEPRSTFAATIREEDKQDEEDELDRLEQQEIQRLERLENDYMAEEAELEDNNNTP